MTNDGSPFGLTNGGEIIANGGSRATAEEIEYLAPQITKDLKDKTIKLECKIEALINKLQSNN